jgi:hypothetical protein
MKIYRGFGKERRTRTQLIVGDEPGYSIHSHVNEDMAYSIYDDDGHGNGEFICATSELRMAERVAQALVAADQRVLIAPTPTKGPKKWAVSYYYLATGMEGQADTRIYGTFEAETREEAIEKAIDKKHPGLDDRTWIRGCLSADELK